MAVIYSTNTVYYYLTTSVRKTAPGNKISTVRKQTNTEHTEEWGQITDEERTCLYTQRSGSRLLEEIWCGQKNVEESMKGRKKELMKYKL